MPAPIIPNDKPAAATIRDGLYLVLTTPLPSRKDRDDDLYHVGCARHKTR